MKSGHERRTAGKNPHRVARREKFAARSRRASLGHLEKVGYQFLSLRQLSQHYAIEAENSAQTPLFAKLSRPEKKAGEDALLSPGKQLRLQNLCTASERYTSEIPTNITLPALGRVRIPNFSPATGDGKARTIDREQHSRLPHYRCTSSVPTSEMDKLTAWGIDWHHY